MRAKKQEKQIKQAPKRYIYIGPSLVREGLFSKQIFIGFPDFTHLKERFPLLNELIVPVSGLGPAMQAMTMRGTASYLARKQILEGGKK